MGKMVVANTGAVPNGDTANISLVEVSDNPDTPVVNPSSLMLVIPIADASEYVVGSKWDFTLTKSTSA